MDVMGLITAFAAGMIITWSLMHARLRELKRDLKQAHEDKDSIREYVIKSGAGLDIYNHDVKQRKQERQQVLLRYIKKNGSITSREVEQLVNVSSATATRYLQELKSEGQIVERGKGRSVHYRLT